MKIHEILSEGRPGRKNVINLFHGTSSKYLKSIKKHGLMPDTGQKGYGSDVPGYESYGGIYLSSSKRVAVGAAEETAEFNGGEPIIITVQYVLGSGGADEDELITLFLNSFSNFSNDAYKFVNRCIDRLPQLPKQNHREIKQIFATLTRLKKNGDQYWEEDSLLDKKFRSQIKHIIEKIKITNLDNFKNVRITRPIKFKGKTRIIDIQPLKK